MGSSFYLGETHNIMIKKKKESKKKKKGFNENIGRLRAYSVSSLVIKGEKRVEKKR